MKSSLIIYYYLLFLYFLSQLFSPPKLHQNLNNKKINFQVQDRKENILHNTFSPNFFSNEDIEIINSIQPSDTFHILPHLYNIRSKDFPAFLTPLEIKKQQAIPNKFSSVTNIKLRKYILKINDCCSTLLHET